MKCGSDRTRHLCPLPSEISAKAPGVFIMNGGLLITSLPPRPRGLTPADEAVIDALRLSVIRNAARLGAYSWVLVKLPAAVAA
jgi:hypothetical protein